MTTKTIDPFWAEHLCAAVIAVAAHGVILKAPKPTVENQHNHFQVAVAFMTHYAESFNNGVVPQRIAMSQDVNNIIDSALTQLTRHCDLTEVMKHLESLLKARRDVNCFSETADYFVESMRLHKIIMQHKPQILSKAVTQPDHLQPKTIH